MQIKVRDIDFYFDIELSQDKALSEVAMEKPSILVLHGGPGIDHSPYRPLGKRLSEFYQVIYLDQLGCGRSDSGPRSAWNLESWADDVQEISNTLNLHRPFLLGHSFGGYVAQMAAVRHRDFTSGLILAGTAPRFVLERSLAMFEKLGSRQVAEIAQRFFASPLANFSEYLSQVYPLYSAKPISPERLAQIVIRPDVADHFVGGEMQSFDLRSRLSEIREPVLILSGDHDAIATPDDIEELRSSLINADVTMKIFTETRHELLHDQESAVVQAICEFIHRCERAKDLLSVI